MNNVLFIFGGFAIGVVAGAVIGLVLEHQLGLCDEVCDYLDKELPKYFAEDTTEEVL